MQQLLKKTAMMPPAQLLPTHDQIVPEHKLRQKGNHQNPRHHKLKRFLSRSRAQPSLNRKNRNKRAVTNNRRNRHKRVVTNNRKNRNKRAATNNMKNRNKRVVTSSSKNRNKRSATSNKRGPNKTTQCSLSHHNHLHHPCRRHQCQD